MVDLNKLPLDVRLHIRPDDMHAIEDWANAEVSAQTSRLQERLERHIDYGAAGAYAKLEDECKVLRGIRNHLSKDAHRYLALRICDSADFYGAVSDATGTYPTSPEHADQLLDKEWLDKVTEQA